MPTLVATSIDQVMNAAVSFLEDAQIPVTPDTHYTMLAAWSDSLVGRQDEYAYDLSTTLCLAMIRLAPKLSVPIQF